MFYRIVIAKKAQKEFKKIKISNPNIADKITILLDSLKTTDKPHLLPNAKKLKNKTDTYRWRVGDYRIIGVIKDKELIIKVIKIAHRQEAYKD